MKQNIPFWLLAFVALAAAPVFGQAPGGPGGGPGGNGTTRNTTLGSLSCNTDQIAKFDGTAWQCAEDQTEGNRFIVRDATGALIGPLVGGLDVVTVAITDSSGNEVGRVPLRLTEFDFVSPLPNRFVYFTSDDCTGTPHVLDWRLAPALLPSALIRDDDRSALYVARVENDPRSMTPGSILRDRRDACATVALDPVDALTAEVVDEDLTTTFPPPFSTHYD